VHNLYVGSDGGVTRINMDDYLGLKGHPFQSNYNRLLPALQCYSTVREFYGTLSASKTQPGLIATGLQDNGNVHCVLGAATTPWVDIDGGDGGWNAFIADGAMLHNTMGGPVAASIVDPAGNVTLTNIVPITSPAVPSGLNGPVGEPVAHPAHHISVHQTLEAAAAVKNEVYALYVDDDGSPSHYWERVGILPDGETVQAVASYNGGSIFAGTASGRMFVVDAKNGTVIELPVVLPKPSPTAKVTAGAINRIVVFSESEAFATMNKVNSKSVNVITGATTIINSFYILQLDKLQWVVTPGIGLPNEELSALEAVTVPNSSLQKALVVTTSERVFVSRDSAATWNQASQGLPRNPHCNDVRFVTSPTGSFLYLGTFGRSVWVARLN
jgi:hypothetical protein